MDGIYFISVPGSFCVSFPCFRSFLSFLLYFQLFSFLPSQPFIRYFCCFLFCVTFFFIHFFICYRKNLRHSMFLWLFSKFFHILFFLHLFTFFMSVCVSIHTFSSSSSTVYNFKNVPSLFSYFHVLLSQQLFSFCFSFQQINYLFFFIIILIFLSSYLFFLINLTFVSSY